MTFDIGIAGFLDRIAATLDLPTTLQEEAERQYGLVGQFLSDQAPVTDWDIYPQGSMRLGTVVSPITGGEGFDLDMVCLIRVAKRATTQAELVQRVGAALGEYLAANEGNDGAPQACKPKRRCWTLYYPSDFHMDVLPALPDLEAQPTGILLTDKGLHEWQHSDPIAYAKWFREQMDQELQRRRKVMAAELRKSIEAVPEWQVRTTLQRVVQLLKRHRDVYFLGDPDDRPPSILITTLATRAYRGDQDLVEAVLTAVQEMPNHIEKGPDGRRGVMSPVAEENFADKWKEYPEREEKFLGWLGRVAADLEDIAQLRGIDRVTARLGESFGADPVTRAAKSLGYSSLNLRESGKLAVAGAAATLTTGAGTRVPLHGFYGDHESR